MKSIVERVGTVSQMLGEVSSGAAVPSDGIGRVGALSQSLKTPQQMRISGKRVNVSHACGACVEQQWNNKAVRGLPEVHFARCVQPASCLTSSAPDCNPNRSEGRRTAHAELLRLTRPMLRTDTLHRPYVSAALNLCHKPCVPKTGRMRKCRGRLPPLFSGCALHSQLQLQGRRCYMRCSA